ncbi:hypothetical protein BD311DRAFT_752091 [Dichomitus squalens]|uniref:Uncharacterized protein n=1 Tax=Dichomitus squalens TaxID=114155 RepID=A0A4V6MW11_9APHY|nr:hypothetical protein BD311DRAFT_752091 [Dichomitus squalens]
MPRAQSPDVVRSTHVLPFRGGQSRISEALSVRRHISTDATAMGELERRKTDTTMAVAGLAPMGRPFLSTQR